MNFSKLQQFQQIRSTHYSKTTKWNFFFHEIISVTNQYYFGNEVTWTVPRWTTKFYAISQILLMHWSKSCPCHTKTLWFQSIHRSPFNSGVHIKSRFGWNTAWKLNFAAICLIPLSIISGYRLESALNPTVSALFICSVNLSVWMYELDMQK